MKVSFIKASRIFLFGTSKVCQPCDEEAVGGTSRIHEKEDRCLSLMLQTKGANLVPPLDDYLVENNI